MKQEYLHAIFEAIDKNNLSVLESIIAKNPAILNEKETSGVGPIIGATPLHYAVIRFQESIASFLIEKGADINTKKNDGLTPLHNACQYGLVTLVKLLIDKGANPNAKSNNDGTPLHAASYGITDTTVNILSLEKKVANLNLPEINHVAVIELLVLRGAELNAKQKSDGMTPLLLAIYRNQELIARSLINYGADIRVSSLKGYSPLHLAAAVCNLSIVGFLLEKGADINALDKDGRKPGEIVGIEAKSIDSSSKTEIIKLLCSSNSQNTSPENSDKKRSKTPGEILKELNTNCSNKEELITRLQEALILLEDSTQGLEKMASNPILSVQVAVMLETFISKTLIDKYNELLNSAKNLEKDNTVIASAEPVYSISKDVINPEDLVYFLNYIGAVSYRINKLKSVLEGDVKIKSIDVDKSNCFIATATVGRPDHPIVNSLRLFRDEILLKNDIGFFFIKCYYFISPCIARIIEKNQIFRIISYH